MQQITVANQRLERYWNCLIVQILVWNWKSTNSTEQKTTGKLNKFTFLFRKLLSFRTTKLCIFLVLKQSNLWSARFLLSPYLGRALGNWLPAKQFLCLCQGLFKYYRCRYFYYWRTDAVSPFLFAVFYCLCFVFGEITSSCCCIVNLRLSLCWTLNTYLIFIL